MRGEAVLQGGTKRVWSVKDIKENIKHNLSGGTLENHDHGASWTKVSVCMGSFICISMEKNELFMLTINN